MNLRMVIVEDEVIVAADVASKVRKFGYQVVATVSTGEEAIALAREECPDFFLMDILLGGVMSGVETAQRLQTFCDVPVVFLTAHSDEETLKRAVSIGPYGYILKPFDERDLMTQLDIARHRHQADKALRERELQLQLISDTAPVLIIHCDREGHYKFVNKPFANRLGLRPEDCMGKPIKEVIGEEGYTILHPYIQRVLSGERVEFEVDVPYDRIGMRHMSCSYAPEVGRDGAIQGFVGAITDVTERKQAEQTARLKTLELQRNQERLLEEGERLTLSMQVAGLGAWETNLTTGRTMWDERLPILLGVPPDEAVTAASHWPDFIHVDDRARILEQYTAACESLRGFDAEFRVLHTSGSVRWFAARSVVVFVGDDKRMVAIVQDITERTQHEEDARRWNHELESRVEERTRKLTQSERQLRELATQLNVAEQRERKRLAAELHDHLAQILVLARLHMSQTKRLISADQAVEAVPLLTHMEDALAESLSYTRTLIADLSPPVLHQFGLTAGLQWFAERMQIQRKFSVKLLLDQVDSSLLPEDKAVLLFQSVRELLLNVAKHAQCNEATVRLTHRPDALRIEVVDQGVGFDPISSASTNNASPLSSHFGHFSIRERMRALGGAFEITSQPGRGTVACLDLPLTEMYAQKDGTPLPSGLVDEVVPLARAKEQESIRVLLVDDHAMLRQGLRSVLEGYKDVAIVGEAGNGLEAIEAVRELSPSVVLMDINMPVMNGIEATKHIKAIQPDTLVIGLSVHAGIETREAMLAVGGYTLLTKEAAVEELYNMIEQAMRGTPQDANTEHSNSAP